MAYQWRKWVPDNNYCQIWRSQQRSAIWPKLPHKWLIGHVTNGVGHIGRHAVLMGQTAWGQFRSPYVDGQSVYVVTVIGISVCIGLPNFLQIGPYSAELWRRIVFLTFFSCCRPTSSIGFSIGTRVKTHLVTKPNFDELSQSMAEVWLLLFLVTEHKPLPHRPIYRHWHNGLPNFIGIWGGVMTGCRFLNMVSRP